MMMTPFGAAVRLEDESRLDSAAPSLAVAVADSRFGASCFSSWFGRLVCIVDCCGCKTNRSAADPFGMTPINLFRSCSIEPDEMQRSVRFDLLVDEKSRIFQSRFLGVRERFRFVSFVSIS